MTSYKKIFTLFFSTCIIVLLCSLSILKKISNRKQILNLKMTNNQNYDEKINILIQKGERASVIESQPIKSDKNSTMHPHNLSSVKHKFGIVLVETRKHNETVSSRIISLIQQIIKTQPDLPCELWLSSNSIINRNLQDFIDSHSTQIFVQYMPSKYTSTDSIYSIDLSSEHGGHIGKAMALRESKFLFPIFFNSDSWPCRNWFNVILNASLESDIIWSLAPIHFGASTNNNASASTTTFLEKNISQYENFRERNTETIFAVRKSSISYAWLTDALNIRAKMSVGSYQTMFRPFQDQAAFRESFFQYRFQLKEHLISSNIACWLTEKKRQSIVVIAYANALHVCLYMKNLNLINVLYSIMKLSKVTIFRSESFYFYCWS